MIDSIKHVVQCDRCRRRCAYRNPRQMTGAMRSHRRDRHAEMRGHIIYSRVSTERLTNAEDRRMLRSRKMEVGRMTDARQHVLGLLVGLLWTITLIGSIITGVRQHHRQIARQRHVQVCIEVERPDLVTQDSSLLLGFRVHCAVDSLTP